MRRKTLNTILSFVFLAALLFAVYYIWQANNSQFSSSSTPAELKPAEDISGIKVQATKIISDRQNNAGIPLPTPIDKLGKPDPFNPPE